MMFTDAGHILLVRSQETETTTEYFSFADLVRKWKSCSRLARAEDSRGSRVDYRPFAPLDSRVTHSRITRGQYLESYAND